MYSKRKNYFCLSLLLLGEEKNRNLLVHFSVPFNPNTYPKNPVKIVGSKWVLLFSSNRLVSFVVSRDYNDSMTCLGPGWMEVCRSTYSFHVDIKTSLKTDLQDNERRFSQDWLYCPLKQRLGRDSSGLLVVTTPWRQNV